VEGVEDALGRERVEGEGGVSGGDPSGARRRVKAQPVRRGPAWRRDVGRVVAVEAGADVARAPDRVEESLGGAQGGVGQVGVGEVCDQPSGRNPGRVPPASGDRLDKRAELGVLGATTGEPTSEQGVHRDEPVLLAAPTPPTADHGAAAGGVHEPLAALLAEPAACAEQYAPVGPVRAMRYGLGPAQLGTRVFGGAPQKRVEPGPVEVPAVSVRVVEVAVAVECLRSPGGVGPHAPQMRGRGELGPQPQIVQQRPGCGRQGLPDAERGGPGTARALVDEQDTAPGPRQYQGRDGACRTASGHDHLVGHRSSAKRATFSK
jgi:hypothetical protein